MLDSDGATGAHRLVGARPVEHGRELYSGIQSVNPHRNGGSRGACPLGLFPSSLGREGVTLAISTEEEYTKDLALKTKFKVTIHTLDSGF